MPIRPNDGPDPMSRAASLTFSSAGPAPAATVAWADRLSRHEPAGEARTGPRDGSATALETVPVRRQAEVPRVIDGRSVIDVCNLARYDARLTVVP